MSVCRKTRRLPSELSPPTRACEDRDSPESLASANLSSFAVLSTKPYIRSVSASDALEVFASDTPAFLGILLLLLRPHNKP